MLGKADVTVMDNGDVKVRVFGLDEIFSKDEFVGCKGGAQHAAWAWSAAVEEVYAELQKMTRHQLMEICGRRYGSKLDLLALSLHANRPAKKASSCLAAGRVAATS